MSYSYNIYTASTPTGAFPVSFPYLEKSDVLCLVNSQPKAFTWINDGLISVSGLTPGDKVEVRRETSRLTRIVDFYDVAIIKEVDLDRSATQLFYLAQEAFDEASRAILLDHTGEFDARGKRIRHMADGTDSQDAATIGQLAARVADYTATVTAIKDQAVTAQVSAQQSASQALVSASGASGSASSASTSASVAVIKASEATTAAVSATASANSASIASATAVSSATASQNAANSAQSAASQAQLAAVQALGDNPPWNSSTTYNYPQMVVYTDGQVYTAVAQSTGEAPPGSVKWKRLTITSKLLMESDGNGDLMPVDDASGVYDPYYELDSNGNLMPR